jgi:putative FmdB family regulatory protein
MLDARVQASPLNNYVVSISGPWAAPPDRLVSALANALRAQYNPSAYSLGGSPMPTYVYRCRQCNNHLEVIQKFSDAPLRICPKCQGPLRRIIHATGIVFKGSGWYVNDSRSSSSTSKPALKESDKSGAAKPDSSPTASTLSEPATTESPKVKSVSPGVPTSSSPD